MVVVVEAADPESLQLVQGPESRGSSRHAERGGAACGTVPVQRARRRLSGLLDTAGHNIRRRRERGNKETWKNGEKKLNLILHTSQYGFCINL
jgi:hypothetical protein